MFFGLEDGAPFGLGEGGRVKDDAIELTPLFLEPFGPIEDITENEIVAGERDVVEGEIPTAPIEIFLGEIQGESFGTGACCADGEAAGVGEGVEEFLAGEAAGEEFEIGGDVVGEEAAAVVALIEEEADGIALVETGFVLDGIFANGEGGRNGSAPKEDGAGVGGIGFADLAIEGFEVEGGAIPLAGEGDELLDF